jgi:predicted nucleic-acid-binding Zn-ribbon protein
MGNFVSYQKFFYWKCPKCGHRETTIGSTPDPPTSWWETKIVPSCKKCGNKMEETNMFDTSFWDFFKDSTKELISEISEAWSDLKQDLKETMEVRYIRPGAIGHCRNEGSKTYCILLGGGQVVALNDDGEPEQMTIDDFKEKCQAKVLFVAGKKRLAVGARDISRSALEAIDTERYPNSKAFVTACISGKDGTVNEQIEARFGNFEWLRYAPPKKTEE